MHSGRQWRYLLLTVVFLTITFALSSCRVPDIAPVPPGGWLDNDAQALRDSVWFQQHKYVDCPRDADDFWPESKLDCVIHFFPERTVESDLAESGQLLIKHFTPTDFLELLPERGAAIKRMSDLTGEVMRGELRDRIREDGLPFASASANSLLVGLEGRTVRSISLMVHPAVERLIVERVGSEKRAELLFQPYLEGAMGRDFTREEIDEVHELYLAALDRCGENAIEGDQSGRGASKMFDTYVAEVQLLFGDGSGDCHIHVESQ